MITETLEERYRAARKAQDASEAQLKSDLIFAAGFLLGSDAPGAASAVEIACHKLGYGFPDVFPEEI